MESSSSKYIARIDHLRCIAALMVLFWHAMRYSVQVRSIDVPVFWPLSFLQEGHTGVALFMVLSGYIFWSLCSEQEVNYVNFIRNRVLRIAPLFVFWMLVYFYTGDIDPSKLFLAAAMLLNKNTIPGNSWTIIVEFQFYLLFPILLLFSRAYGLRYLIGLLCFAIVFRWTVWLITGTVQELAYSTIFGRIDQFLLGMIVCELARRKRSFFRSRYVLFLFILTWVVIFHEYDEIGGYFDNIGGYPSSSSVWVYWPFLEGFFYAFITAYYVGGGGSLPSFLDKGLKWIGMISYSLYLNQNFAILIADKAFKAAGWQTAGLFNSLAFCAFGIFPILVTLSAMTYYLLERPFLIFRKPYLVGPAKPIKKDGP